jgi:hypothetical protein
MSTDHLATGAFPPHIAHGHRLVAIIALAHTSWTPQGDEQRAFDGADPPYYLGGLADAFRESPHQSTLVLADATWPGSAYACEARDGRPRTYASTGVRGTLLGTPSGDAALHFTLDFDGDRAACIEAMIDISWRLHRVSISGHGVLDAVCAAASPAIADAFSEATLTADRHSFFIEPTTEIFGVPSAGAATMETDLGIAFEFLHQLLFRTSQPARPSFSRVILPIDTNRHDGTLLAVRESATVAANQQAHLLNGHILAATHTVIAARRSRAIRSHAALLHQAFRGALARPHPVGLAATQAYRAELAALEGRLAELELDLSFAVEGNIEFALVMQSTPQSEYQAHLVSEIGLDHALAVSERMLSRLGSAIRSSRTVIEATTQLEIEDNQATLLARVGDVLTVTRTARTIAVVAGIVTAIVAGVGLFAALAAVPSQSQGGTSALLLTPFYRAAALAAASVIFAAGYGLILWRLAERDQPRHPRQLLAAACVLLATSTAALLLTLDHDVRSSGGFAAGALLLLAAGALLALNGNFSSTSGDTATISREPG